MTSPTSSTSLIPFPPVPIELKGHILSFCDAPTLAAAARCSLAFLELASPILYEKVEVSGMWRLASLLCTTADHPHLARYLSLAQIKNLSYEQGVSEGPVSEKDPRDRLRTPTRLLSRTPMPLAELHISVGDFVSWGREPEFEEYGTRDVLEGLLSLFNPTLFTFENRGALLDVSNGYALPLTITLDEVHQWTRIKTLKLVNAISYHLLHASAFLASGTDRRVDVVYDLRGIKRSNAFQDLIGDLKTFGGAESEGERRQRAERIRHIRVVVDTEKERSDVLEGIHGSILFDRIAIFVRA